MIEHPWYKRWLTDWHYPAAVAICLALILVAISLWVLTNNNTDLNRQNEQQRQEQKCRSQELSTTVYILGQQQIILDDIIVQSTMPGNGNMEALIPALTDARNRLEQQLRKQLQAVEACTGK